MDALVFPAEAALEVALRSGLVPAEVHGAAAQVRRLDDGSVELVPSVPLSVGVVKVLKSVGVVVRAPSGGLTDVGCWAEALRARSSGEPAQVDQVLFAATSTASLLSVAGELLRLGCDRLELRLLDGADGVHGLIRAAQPPWYVLARALDGLDGLQAFVPTAASQGRAFVQLGFTHPLDAALDTTGHGLVFIRGDGGWLRVEDGPWTDVDQLITASGLAGEQRLEAGATLPAIPVRLSLGRAARAEPPTLFFVQQGRAAVESLVRGTPEAQLEDVLFAVCGEDVVLLARPGRAVAAEALPGVPYARILELQHLFAPWGQTVEPPLRRDRLRTWLAPDDDVLTWLTEGPQGLSRTSLPEAAFRPLLEWVDYVVDGAAEVLHAWERSATFDFEPFAASEDVAPALLPAPVSAPPVAARPAASSDDASPPSASRPQRDALADRAPRLTPSAMPLEALASELEVALQREEAAFLELEAAGDAAPRRQAWVRLAEAYGRLARHSEAGLAWASAVWTAPEDEAPALAKRWAESSPVRFDAALSGGTPSEAQTRGVVAHLVARALEPSPSLPRAAEWLTFLDRYDDDLDVRSFWLGRQALSKLSGGDALGLARARDKLLLRLQRGLSMERDVPRLLRVAGQNAVGGAGTERARRVSEQLEVVLKAFEDTPRKRSTVEAPWALTRPYVQLEFAWGFARLGAVERARQLRDGALATLDRTQPVHDYLAAAYAARVTQALEGASPQTPLPAAVGAQLAALEPFLRYKVDRLRQASAVLGQDRADATGAYLRSSQGSRGEELASLRGVRDPAELLKALEARSSAAMDGNLSDEERARLLSGLVDFLPGLPESQAVPLLLDYVSTADTLAPNFKVLVLEDALKVAGHFGRVALVKQLVAGLGRLIKQVGVEGVAELGPSLAAGVRSLRRVGLREEASELLQAAAAVLKGEDTRTLQARLALAAGFTFLGATERALPILDEAQRRLAQESGLSPPDRLKLTRAMARTLSHAATDQALPGLLRLSHQLPWVTDSFATNDHFCLSVIDFADALVMGHAGDDLTLNERTRRYLEEDEYLVRRRVHHDVGGGG